MKSQTERLKKHLQEGKSITRLESLKTLGIFELSARLVSLEKEGMIINRKWLKVTNRWGEETRVKQYWINKNKNKTK